jgi:hypothetical protein
MMKIAALALVLLSSEGIRSRPVRGGTEFRIPLPSKAYPKNVVLQVSVFPRVRHCTYGAPVIREEWGEAVFQERARATREVSVQIRHPGEYMIRVACLPRHQIDLKIAEAMKKGRRYPRFEFIVLAGTPEERLGSILLAADRLTHATKAVAGFAEERSRKGIQGLARLIHDLRRLRDRSPLTAACEYSETWIEAVYCGLAFEQGRAGPGSGSGAARGSTSGGRAVDDDTVEGGKGENPPSSGIRRCRSRAKAAQVDLEHLRKMIGRECALLTLFEAECWLRAIGSESRKRLEERLALIENTCVVLTDRHSGFKAYAPGVQDVTARLRNLLRENPPSEETVEGIRRAIRTLVEKHR